MALFGKRRSHSDAAASDFPFAKAPDLVASVPPVREAVARQDWDAARDHVGRTTPHDREAALRVLAESAPYAWAEQQATDALGNTIAGAVAVISGWRARGNAESQHVSGNQFANLRQWMDRADGHLAAALQTDDSDPTPAVYALVTARGSERSLADVETVFRDLKRRDPEHLEGHLQRMQYSCQKWFGSHEQMYSFASSAADAAPPGSELHVLPLVAHAERLVAFNGKGTHAQQLAYASTPTFMESVNRALSRLTPGTHGYRLAHNHAAFFAWVRRDRAAFEAAFRQIDWQVTNGPWEMYDDDVLAFVISRSFHLKQ